MAIQNLKAKKFRTIFMMFFVVLMTATFFFSTLLMDNLKLGIKNTTGKMGAELSASCCDASVQLVAFDPSTDFVIQPWLNSHEKLELQDGEVVAQVHLPTDDLENVISMLMIDVDVSFEGMDLASLKIDIENSEPSGEKMYACTADAQGHQPKGDYCPS